MSAKTVIDAVRSNIAKSIVGSDASVTLMIIALLCGGHVLIEDVPGTGKTMLARALASSLDCKFSRIQFTPDLLPSDITGINYFNMKKSEFEFLPGPVFTNILLADEINRATPKTQSGLLECMEERQVSIDGKTYRLDMPFMVAATQNPVESMGTFPLPEAQLDRFLVKTKLGYPSHEDSCRILSLYENGGGLKTSSPAASKDDVIGCMRALSEIYVDRDIYGYVTSVCEATRKAQGVVLGASPRAAIALLKVAKGFALCDGRRYAIPDDVKAAAIPVLAHRLILTASERLKRNAAENIVGEIIASVSVPTERIFDGGATHKQ